ncbi:MAG: ruvC [Microgenomates group bacterium Gr01-1014_80]|nr:MAG: ruvC [Microgenomates group bacterium Gr01-1014_80]
MIILGIDPGIGRMGWGIIKDEAGKQTPLGFGCLETSSKVSLDNRLAKVHHFVLDLIGKFKPDIMAIEQLYFSANSKTALTVGQARGVILLAAAGLSVPTISYTPLQVKQAITGYGRADKNQILQMVSHILRLSANIVRDDTADALAIALTHAFSYKLRTISQYKLA